VANSEDNTTPENAEVQKTAEASTPANPTAQQRPQIQIDDSHANAAYANFCRVTGTPEELILDFGLNPQPFGIPKDPIAISHRLIVNFYTAKRMLQALSLTIQRQEATFGVLETDVQKRVTPSARQPMNQPQA